MYCTHCGRELPTVTGGCAVCGNPDIRMSESGNNVPDAPQTYAATDALPGPRRGLKVAVAGTIAALLTWTIGSIAGGQLSKDPSPKDNKAATFSGRSTVATGSQVPRSGLENSKDDPISLLQLVKLSNRKLNSESQFLSYVQKNISDQTQYLRSIEKQMTVLTTKTTAEQSQVMSILRFQYEYGVQETGVWIQMLFAAKNWHQLQSNLGYLQVLMNRRARVLQTYEKTMDELKSAQTLSKTSLENLHIASTNASLEKQDYLLATRQSASSVPANTTMSNLHEVLRRTWQTTVAPQLADILTNLDKSAATLPQSLAKSDIHISATSAHISVSQTEFNHILHTNQALRKVTFLFRSGHLLVFANDGNHSLLVFGHFVIGPRGQTANYEVEGVAVDGILVDSAETKQWLKPYHFGVDVTQLAKHIHIRSVVLSNQQLSLKVTLF